MTATLGRAAVRATGAVRTWAGATITRVARHGRDRGDVPGWVLITVMTAGLVTVLWSVASRELSGIFESAVSSVTGP